MTTRRLTEFSHGAGCACKLDPGVLVQVVQGLTPSAHPALLVGPQTGDDAAVWKLDDERALVVTTDFITPVVDDPRDWGRVAATNAVSDVYAMGGRPLLALNLVCWNDEELSADILGAVLDGAQSVAAAAGFVVVGGHTVTDPEPKYGLAVVGEVAPDRLLTNAGLRAGDALVLTKPVGVGVVTTAIKRGGASDDVIAGAIASMTRLNAEAARVALAAGATGATDVTVQSAVVPVLEGARELAAAGYVPGGSARNLRWVEDRLDRGHVDELTVMLLADAQTSGGLVFGVAPERADSVAAELVASGHQAAVIGEAVAGAGRIRVR
jgi:selenide,water dikinase